MSEIPSKVLKTAVTVVVMLIVLTIIASVSFTGTASLDPQQGSNSLETLISGSPTITSVTATKENALLFSPGDHVDTRTQNFSNTSWTVCAAVELRDGTNLNDTYNIFAWDNGSLLLQYDAQQWSIFFENATGADGKAVIAAPTPTDGLTAVCGRYNETSNRLFVFRDGTASAPDKLDGTTDVRNLSNTWNGTIDELRTFDAAENNSTISAYSSDPIVPLPNANRSSRYMFDEGSGSTTVVYFGPVSSVSIDGATWTTGVPDPGLVEGTDYRITRDPFALVVPSGSYLVGAPVVYLTWARGGLGIPFVSFISAMVGVLIIVHIARQADLL